MMVQIKLSNLSQVDKRKWSNSLLVIITTLLSIIYFFSGYIKWLELVVTVGAGIFFLFAPVQQSFCLFLFLHNFINSNFTVAYSFRFTFNIFTIILAIKYLVGLKRKKYKFYTNIFFCLLIVFILSILLSIPEKKYYAAEAYISYLPLFYLFFAMRHEFNIREAMKYFLYGFVLSCVLAYFSMKLPDYSYNINKYRFGAFSENPNYLYMRALLIISFYLHLFLTENISLVKLAPVFIFCAFITLTTRSKTGICLLLLITLLSFIIYLRNDFKKRIKIVGICLLGLILFSIFMRDFISSIWERFTYSNGDFINSLLTGRDTIWLEYIRQWCKTPISFLFGKGLLTAEPYVNAHNNMMASHNLYLFLLYRFGLLGSILLGFSFYLMVKTISKKPQNISAYLPLTWFLLESFCDNTFKAFNIIFLVIVIMILFSNQSKNSTKK